MEMARTYVRRAVEALAPFPDTESKRSLTDIGEYVLTRKS
jgi:geranylgeranyl pyrophosphate synthase